MSLGQQVVKAGIAKVLGLTCKDGTHYVKDISNDGTTIKLTIS